MHLYIWYISFVYLKYILCKVSAYSFKIDTCNYIYYICIFGEYTWYIWCINFVNLIFTLGNVGVYTFHVRYIHKMECVILYSLTYFSFKWN